MQTTQSIKAIPQLRKDDEAINAICETFNLNRFHTEYKETLLKNFQSSILSPSNYEDNDYLLYLKTEIEKILPDNAFISCISFNLESKEVGELGESPITSYYILIQLTSELSKAEQSQLIKSITTASEQDDYPDIYYITGEHYLLFNMQYCS